MMCDNIGSDRLIYHIIIIYAQLCNELRDYPTRIINLYTVLLYETKSYN